MSRRRSVDPARFSGALRQFIAEHNLSQAEAAERVGVAQSRISTWVAGTAAPSLATAERILPTMHLKLADVAPLADANARDAAALADQIVFVPREEAVGAASRFLPVPADEPTSDPYPASELRRMLGYDPGLLVSAVVVGDSIKNIIPAGTRVMYFPTTEVGDHGLYILDLDGARIIKLVQRLAGDVLAVISANKAYRTETYTPCLDADTPNTYRSDLSSRTATLSIVGKVVWFPKLA